MRIKLFFLLSIFFLWLSCSQNKQLCLVENGTTNYEIVVPEKADSTIIKAVGELQKYIEQMTTVRLSVVAESNSKKEKNKIYVGLKANNLESPHSVSIYNEGKNLIITGGNSKSVLYAVFTFLENYLGCKWYSPAVEKIPQVKTISIHTPLNFVYTPPITTRTVHSRLFYDNPGFADKLKVTHNAFPGYVPTARVHTFHRFVPEKVYFKTHPEYFALINGKRVATQLCLTNSHVLKIVTDSVKAYFNRYPNANVISVSQNDNTQHCQCDACKKIDREEEAASGTMIRFVNQVAKNFPDKQISTLAYQYTRKPCKTKPAANVLITLCSIECDRSAPIEQKCTDFATDLVGWKAKTDNIRIWDYTTQFTNFLAPFPNIRTLQPNIRFFRDNHATWIFEQHSNQPSELFELRSYLTAKLLWNPDLNSEEIITDFTNGYYEDAGVFIKKYIDLIHSEIEKDSDFFLFLYGDPAQAFNSFLRPELLEKYNTFFNDAEKAVANKPAVLQRVKVARISTDYAMLEMARNGMSPKFQLLENGKVSADVKKRLTRFKNSCESANITLMNEMGYTVKEYLDLYNEIIKKAAMPNVARGKKVILNTKPKKYAGENPQALTDGALGGSNFYANWLGFEGNNLDAVIDLGKTTSVHFISSAFLQVTNHIVFFPERVSYYYSTDNKKFRKIKTVINSTPLSKTSKKNDVKNFDLFFSPVKARYIKIVAKNIGKAPAWHNAAGLPAWIFVDEVIVN